MTIAALALGLTFASAPLEAQRNSDAPVSFDLVTQRIQDEYDAIQRGIPGYSSVQRDFTSAEGFGVLTAFLDRGGLVKLVVQLARSSEGRVTEFYFWDDDLIFVLDASERFPAAPATDSSSAPTENRFWFDQRKLVKWLESPIGPDATATSVAPSQPRFTAKSTEIVQLSDLWRAFVRSGETDFSRFSAAASGSSGDRASGSGAPAAASASDGQ